MVEWQRKEKSEKEKKKKRKTIEQTISNDFDPDWNRESA